MSFIHGVEVLTILDGSRPIQSKRISVAGIIGTAPDADAQKFPLNTPVRVLGSTDMAGLGATGTLPTSLDGFYDNGGGTAVIIRVDEGASETDTLTNIVGDAATLTGVHAFKAAESLIKLTPRILVATGWTHQRPNDNANPVVAELKGVAESLRAVFYADGPNTTDAAALAAALELGDARGRLIDPWSSVFRDGSSVLEPASARMAGRRVQVDDDLGFWHSVSNQPLAGITGLGRPIHHEPSNVNGQTNLLNAGNVTTLIHRDGFRIWGNRGTGAEPLTAFQSVLRTMDSVELAMESAFAWALDQPMSAQLFLDIADSVNAYLRSLTARGALLGGRCWFDPDLNDVATLQAGRAYLNFDIEPPGPLERLTFSMYREPDYYASLADQVATSLAA
ncbi:phage tail sheath C-terminal domain-containing protein [Algimonas porphyrae]|uniref:Tail sheath protein n=1 Tax=Algimonas porphyrae TaxID=1128113 RepID=A0ABQ5V139_9PROT|nr:phage tail sheath C-terminal domain-containing protein [Algimonas porphyrae]GLQ20513.1 tail sheath protein [Algimonas porphyrae]